MKPTRTLEDPKVGQVYGDRDPLSRYRVRVVAVVPELNRIGRKGIQLENLGTGRLHWTSLRQMYSAYRLVREAREEKRDVKQ